MRAKRVKIEFTLFLPVGAFADDDAVPPGFCAARLCSFALTVHAHTLILHCTDALGALFESINGGMPFVPTLPCGVTDRACLRHATNALGN